MPETFQAFNFKPGRKVGPRYVVEQLLGKGTEGEVYQIRELQTGIKRAAKFYYPHKDPKNRLPVRHARKLNALRHCPIVLQYHHSEIVTVRKSKVVAMISDLCDGEQLEGWIHKHPGRRLRPFRAMLLLYHLVVGLEMVHAHRQYHADVHTQNILIQPRGVRFELTLVDFYDWGKTTRYKQQQDIYDAIGVFHEALGGAKAYAKHPPEVKYICAGLKRSIMFKRFPTMHALRVHLETFEWANVMSTG